ncbi:MAG: glycoside hydrolase family 9 protein [Oscillospiraceae bacterium]
MKNHLIKRILSGIIGLSVLSVSGVTAFADAGEAPPEITDDEYVFPDPDSFSYDDVEVNFAKALQYSLYFYDANKCGSGEKWLEWRGDCHMEDAAIPLVPMLEEGADAHFGTNLSQEFIDEYKDILDPDGDGYIDCSGGMHDAGDHVKFGLPGSYAASTVGWGYYEFRDAYKESGQQEHVEDILHWFNDFYMDHTYLDENGDVIAYCYQVGEGNNDHNYWSPPELQDSVHEKDFARPAYFATVDTPASDMCAGTAASLAINYLNFKDTEPEYAEESLEKAIALYEFAVKTHSELDDGKTVTSLGYDGGFYTSSYDYDELAWAAVWLYECTGNYDYINDIIAVDETISGEMGAHPYTGYIKRIIADTGNCWQNIWVHCWDTVWGGVFAKLAPITNISRDWYIFRWNLEYWSGMTEADAAAAASALQPAVTSHKYFGPDDVIWNTTITADEIADLPETQGAWLAKTPAGFAMLNEYGSARYDAAAQLCALVYAKETGDMTFADWAEGQMEYIMGKNPMNRPYIVGYSPTAASHPHHRAAHGSSTYSMDDPETQTHVLWGALVGGPDSNDWHRDITKDYIYNEVAVDYNAAFTGACAGLYNFYATEDMQPQENFPPAEPKNIGFRIEGLVNQENTERTQFSVCVYNLTTQPPQYVDGLSARYFINLEEIYKAGQTVDDVIVEVYYDEVGAATDNKQQVKVTGPFKWSDDPDDYTYYVEMDWSGIDFYGTRELQIGIIVGQDADYNSNWDPTNDYSRQDIVITDVYKDYGVTDKIPLYYKGELVYGVEPDGKSSSEDNPSAEKNPDAKLLGDVTLDGLVDIRDVTHMAQYIVKMVNLNDEAFANGDIMYDDTVDVKDLSQLKKYLIKAIDEL